LARKRHAHTAETVPPRYDAAQPLIDGKPRQSLGVEAGAGIDVGKTGQVAGSQLLNHPCPAWPVPQIEHRVGFKYAEQLRQSDQ